MQGWPNLLLWMAIAIFINEAWKILTKEEK